MLVAVVVTGGAKKKDKHKIERRRGKGADG